MNNKVLVISLVLTALFSNCKREQMDDCFTGTGNTKTDNRPLEAFSHLVIDDLIEVTYVTAPTHSLRIKAGENLLEGIKTEVKDGVLHVQNENRCNWVRSFKKKIEITLFAPELQSLEMYGGSSFFCSDTIKTQEFRANLWSASGKLDVLLAADYVELKSHTGPADILAKGSCRELVAYSNGNGSLNSLALLSEKALVVNQNTGKIEVQVTQEMNVDLRGSGNIYYLGNPQITLLDEGKGNLISLN